MNKTTLKLPIAHLAMGISLIAFLVSCAPAAPTTENTFARAENEQSSIVGGVNATLNYAKQNGVVGVFDLESQGLCTGSLIGPNLVLTAGHCINAARPENLIIFFGLTLEEVIKQSKAGINTGYRFATKAIHHERFISGKPAVAGSSNNDIGLISFVGTVPQGFKIAKLASKALSQNLKVGSEVSLAGYGLNKFKRDPTTGQALMKEGSGTLRKVDKIKVLSVMASGEEITFDQSQGRGACHGDSGGPAYFFDKTSRKNMVVGVTSRGTGSCNEVVIYTAVMGYENWISEKSKELLQ